MIYENTLIMYLSNNDADEHIKKQMEEDNKYFSLIDKLRSLREFDPEGYEELEEAMRIIRGEKHLYSMNLFAEYGLLENPEIKALIERQERILSIVRSNKNLSTLQEAMQTIAA